MKLIVGMAAFSLGYTLIYYGVVMFRGYDSTNPNNTRAIPFGALLGFTSNYIGGDINADWAKPPFRFGAAVNTSGTPSSAPAQASGSGGVQNV